MRLAAAAIVCISTSLVFSAVERRAGAQAIADIWEANCINCHAKDGHGGGAGTRSLLVDEKFGQKYDREFFDAIKNGIEGTAMPGYAKTLSDEKIWGLVVHIRELQAKEHRSRVGDPKAVEGVYTTQHATYKIETVIKSGLDTPWSVAFLPPGGALSGMLVTERPGPVHLFKDGKLGAAIEGTPKVFNRGQGGMMDVAPHPDYATNGWIYLAYSDAKQGSGRGPNFTKIVRGKIVAKGDGLAWTDEQTIFQAKPEHYVGSDIHFGCRIVFQRTETTKATDPAKWYVYFAIGERGMGERAQDLTLPNGKIYRLWDDGTIPADNPFVDRKGAYTQIWSYGHRNPQGLAFDLDGKLWDTEHGPRGGDELNLIKPGANYGWPEVAFSINYDGSAYRTPWGPDGKAKDGKEITMPADRWLPSCAACGLDVMNGEPFAPWKGDLMAGGLAGENVDRVRIIDGVVTEREEIIHGLGRVRDVVCGPNGFLYVVLNDPHKVIRLVPGGEAAPKK